MSKVVIGKIRTSHGVMGDLKVMSTSEEYEHFKKLKSVTLRKGNREKTFKVEAVNGKSTGTRLKLEGIDTPEEGKLYAGYEIIVDSKFASPCKKGEYYQSDLVGCNLIFNKETMGEVLAILNGGPNDLLEVKKKSDEKVVLVPFRDEFIGDVNISGKEIELRVDWILD